MRTLMCAGLLVAMAAGADGSDTGQAGISDAQVQEIITRFAAKETEFAHARENYTYRQTARVQEVDAGGAPEGKWEMVVDVIFSTEGKL